MNLSLLIFVISVSVVSAGLDDRKGKFFPVITFPNDECRGDNNNWGVCYSSKQCSRTGGRKIGNCALNYGTCCSVETDGTGSMVTHVTRNLTTIVNPPIELLPRTSMFRFIRQPGVCQLKLNFDRFVLSGADANTSNCARDYMRITGSVTVNTLEICGQLNNNEHMYLDYGQGNQIDIVINAQGSQDAMTYGYRFRVTQIKCESALRVPQKCLQYFTNETARVTSFNFPNQQLNNQQYTVCVEQRDPNANLQWSECPPPLILPAGGWFPFSITGETVPMVPPGGTPPITPPLPGEPPGPPGSSNTCAGDYVEFFSAGKFCTMPFPNITTPAYEMFVHFDRTEQMSNKGTLIMQNCFPPYPEPNEGYGPWYASTTVVGECTSLPLTTTADARNVGFCLVYSTVQKRIN